MVLTTERLVLRPFTNEDLAGLRTLTIEKESESAAQYDHPWPTDEAGLRGVLSWAVRSDTFFAICLREPHAAGPIGFVSLSPDGSGAVRNLGYFLSPRYRGHGYAYEACAEAIRHAFAELGTGRIFAGTAAANTPSIRLLERLGFQRSQPDREVSLRKTASGEPIPFTGRALALTLEDWRRNRNPGPQVH